MIRLAVLPVPILAVTHVIAVVPTNVHAVQRTIPDPMPAQLSAVRLAVTAKTVLQEVRLIPVIMSGRPNAVAAILVPTTAGPEQKAAFPAQVIIFQPELLLPNAAQDAMNADIILIVTLLPNHALTAVLLRTHAESALHASPSRQLPVPA